MLTKHKASSMVTKGCNQYITFTQKRKMSFILYQSTMSMSGNSLCGHFRIYKGQVCECDYREKRRSRQADTINIFGSAKEVNFSAPNPNPNLNEEKKSEIYGKKLEITFKDDLDVWPKNVSQANFSYEAQVQLNLLPRIGEFKIKNGMQFDPANRIYLSQYEFRDKPSDKENLRIFDKFLNEDIYATLVLSDEQELRMFKIGKKLGAVENTFFLGVDDHDTMQQNYKLIFWAGPMNVVANRNHHFVKSSAGRVEVDARDERYVLF